MQATLEIKPTAEQMATLKTELKTEIAESLKLDYIAVDKVMLLKILPYGETFLNDEILSHPKVRVHQRRKGERGKLVWIYEPTKKAILEIMNDWI